MADHSTTAAKPLKCTCARTRVDAYDHILLEGRSVVVHGLHHCFAYERTR